MTLMFRPNSNVVANVTQPLISKRQNCSLTKILLGPIFGYIRFRKFYKISVIPKASEFWEFPNILQIS